jgi:hypothetical protein
MAYIQVAGAGFNTEDDDTVLRGHHVSLSADIACLWPSSNMIPNMPVITSQMERNQLGVSIINLLDIPSIQKFSPPSHPAHLKRHPPIYGKIRIPCESGDAVNL